MCFCHNEESCKCFQTMQDNDVYIEFHNDCCLIKTKDTGKTILKGMHNEGLY